MSDLQDNLERIQFDENDVANGGYVPTIDQNGTLRVRSLGRQAGGVRDKMTMAMMKADMAALWRDGETYRDIAEAVSDKYNLTGDQRLKSNGIHYHIKSMLDFWRQKGLARMDERQAMLLARLDQIESLALEGYFASMEGKKTSHVNKQIQRAKSKDRKDQLLDKVLDQRESESRDDKRYKINKKQAPLFQDTGELADLLVTTQEKIDEHVRLEENSAGDVKFLALMFNINKERASLLGLHNRKEMLDPDQESAKLTDEQRHQKLATILTAARERREASTGLLAPPAPMGGFQEGHEPAHTVIEVMLPEVDELVTPDADDDWGFGPDVLSEIEDVTDAGGDIEWD